MEERLIDANALKARIQAWKDRLKGYYGTNDDMVITLDKVQKQIIDSMPTVDAVPWEFLERYADWFCASVSFPQFIQEAKAFYRSSVAAMDGGFIIADG